MECKTEAETRVGDGDTQKGPPRSDPLVKLVKLDPSIVALGTGSSLFLSDASDSSHGAKLGHACYHPHEHGRGHQMVAIEMMVQLQLMQLQLQLQQIQRDAAIVDVSKRDRQHKSTPSVSTSTNAQDAHGRETQMVRYEPNKRRAREKGGKQITVMVRWTLGSSFSDAEREGVTIPLNSTATELTMALTAESGFIRRWCAENKSQWDWSQFDLTMGELGWATLLPSYVFQRAEHLVDVLPRARVPLQYVDDHGAVQWLFETPTARQRREYREMQERREIARAQIAHPPTVQWQPHPHSPVLLSRAPTFVRQSRDTREATATPIYLHADDVATQSHTNQPSGD